MRGLNCYLKSAAVNACLEIHSKMRHSEESPSYRLLGMVNELPKITFSTSYWKEDVL